MSTRKYEKNTRRNIIAMAQSPSTMSRDLIVNAISNFYTFLTTYPFLPITAIKTPPSSGWPEEYLQIWRKMGNLKL